VVYLFFVLVFSPREIRQGEEIAWYADGETVVRNEHNPSTAYAYGNLLSFLWMYLIGMALVV
jgi:hypothetical protein